MRRTPTPESFDRQKKHKTTQVLTALDKCLQIPHDDRLLLRKMVKDSHPRVSAIFEQFRKDRSMAELQIKLRKVVQSTKINKRTATLQSDQSSNKEINKESCNKQSKESRQGSAARRVESLQSQGSSFQNSHKDTPEKVKKVITLDIGALREKLEEGNSHRSNAHNYYLRQKGRERGMSRNLSVGKVAPVSAVAGADDVRSNRSQANLLLNGSLERGRLQSNRDRLQSNKERDRNKNVLNSINSRDCINSKDGRDTRDSRESRDYSQITIRICSRPKAHNKQDTAQQCYGMKDITNSYSSSIKHLLASKLKQDTKPKEQQRREQQRREQQKREEQRRKEEEIFQSWKKSNQGNGQSSQDDNNNRQNEDKLTAVKRPAKPMHRDEPALGCFHESQHSQKQSKQWKQNKQWKQSKQEKEWKCQYQYQPIFLRHQEEEASTVRDKPEERSSLEYGGRLEERPTEGHFFRRIREIMESKE